MHLTCVLQTIDHVLWEFLFIADGTRLTVGDMFRLCMASKTTRDVFIRLGPPPELRKAILYNSNEQGPKVLANLRNILLYPSILRDDNDAVFEPLSVNNLSDAFTRPHWTSQCTGAGLGEAQAMSLLAGFAGPCARVNKCQICNRYTDEGTFVDLRWLTDDKTYRRTDRRKRICNGCIHIEFGRAGDDPGTQYTTNYEQATTFVGVVPYEDVEEGRRKHKLHKIEVARVD